MSEGKREHNSKIGGERKGGGEGLIGTNLKLVTSSRS